MIPGHETILNTLNKWKNYADGPAYLAVENFLGTEPLWDKVPLIFAQEHPDNDLVESDLPAALASVKDYKGRPATIPGFVSDTSVETQGQPRIRLKTTFTDPEVQALYDAGLLALSHGLYADKDEADHLVGKVRPNHVLVFVQDAQNQPVDQGSMFLSKQSGGDLMQQFQGIGKKISEAHRQKFKSALDTLHGLLNEMLNVKEDDLDAKGTASVPQNPSGYGTSTGSWSAPPKGDMPFEEYRRLFAYDDGSGTTAGLKLPHHNPNGDVVKAGVDAAMARLSQTQGLGDLEEDVRAHLERHQIKDFGEPSKTGKEEFMDKEMEAKLAAAEAEKSRLAKELADTQTALKQVQAKMTEYEAKVSADAEKARVAKLEEDWNLAKTVLDVGLIHKQEDNDARKVEFFQNPAAFMAKYCAKVPADPKKEDGQQFAGKGGDQDEGKKKLDPVQIGKELRLSTGRRL
jgi:hypothetical protein